MTFNIRNGMAKDGDNHWNLRKDFVCDVIRDYAPDVLGLQEAFRFQLDLFNQKLPEYGEVGMGRDGGTKGEYASILYLKKRFRVDESGTFWLSETPSIPSKHWGHYHRRICTWGRFMDLKTERFFYVFNTHMDHRSQRARENGIQLIIKRIQERTHPDPFLLTGDFNAGESNRVVGYLKGSQTLEGQTPIPLLDSFRVLHPNEKVVGTGSRFSGYTSGPKIDHIFVDPGTRVLEATIVRTHRDGRYPSDHYPVTAQLRFKPSSEEAEERTSPQEN
jgi:endonuclease/exonuclease/phosphatase family metal-dependent hydrolase